MARLGWRLVIGSVALLSLALLIQSCTSARKPKATSEAGFPPPGSDQYVGSATCQGCHEDQFSTFSHTKMGRLFLNHPRDAKEKLGCEGCHGPGKAHAESGGKEMAGLITFAKNDRTPVERRNAVCLTCHQKADRLLWAGSPHESRDVACTSCHKIMENVSPAHQLAKPTEIETCGTCHIERRAQTMRFSHMPLREGKMTCTSCHNPHGTVTPSLLKEASVNDTCYTCHAEKRGPFLWEHAPVTENCVNCHDPHGSNHERMLKVAKPRLCQQCHIETRHPTNPYGPNDASMKFVLGRACASCHVNIHGSNHPSGNVFTR